jgi:hypothetical protein
MSQLTRPIHSTRKIPPLGPTSDPSTPIGPAHHPHHPACTLAPRTAPTVRVAPRLLGPTSRRTSPPATLSPCSSTPMTPPLRSPRQSTRWHTQRASALPRPRHRLPTPTLPHPLRAPLCAQFPLARHLTCSRLHRTSPSRSRRDHDHDPTTSVIRGTSPELNYPSPHYFCFGIHIQAHAIASILHTSERAVHPRPPNPP